LLVDYYLKGNDRNSKEVLTTEQDLKLAYKQVYELALSKVMGKPSKLDK
jgi:hypothetical protein